MTALFVVPALLKLCPDQGWQKREEGAFRATDFAVDWERRRVRCPEGHEGTGWSEYKASGRLQPGRLPALPVEVALHPCAEPPPRVAPAPGTRGGARGRSGAARK